MTQTKIFGVRLAVVLAVALSFAVPAGAQVTLYDDPGSSIRTREELQSLLAMYDDVLASPVYSETVKTATRLRAERVRERLTDGDFALGDAIALYVEGEMETLPDTVAVEAGPKITLPVFGAISLHGVLRSEVQDHLTTEMGRFIRDPVVRAEGLLRVSVQGSVGQPGFYVIPADMLLTEAIMLAGGPQQTSDLRSLRIERGTEVVMEGEELQEALRQGRTFDQLNLQAGDQLMVPQDSGGFWRQVAFALGIVSSVVFIINLAGR